MTQAATVFPEASVSADALWKRLFRSTGFWPFLSLLVLLWLFISVTSRAIGQGITGDEAFNYTLYLNGAFGKVFLADYDANNHVLYTALAWISIHLFGLNEFNLRLPSVIAAAIFFVTVFRISTTVFGRGPVHLLSTILLAGNPYLLDFFTVARGYGLGIAFLALAVLQVLRLSAEPMSSRRLLRAGIYAAGAVTANLGMLFPITALFLTMIVVEFHRAGFAPDSWWAMFLEMVRNAFGPFLVLSFCILVMPLRTASRSNFYLGAPTWHMCIDSVVSPSLFHNLRIPLLAKWPALFWAIYSHIADQVIPLLALIAAAAAVMAIVQRREKLSPMLAATCTMTLTILVLWTVHLLLNLKLPIMRTGIYLAFLLPFALLSLLAATPGTLQRRAGLLLTPVLIFWALLYIPQWRGRATADWRYDASSKEFARSIELLRAASGANSITVGGSWIFEPALNFYRNKFGYVHWQPVAPNKKVTDPADYYLISDNDRAAIATMKLRVIVDDPVSRAVLAVGGSPACR